MLASVWRAQLVQSEWPQGGQLCSFLLWALCTDVGAIMVPKSPIKSTKRKSSSHEENWSKRLTKRNNNWSQTHTTWRRMKTSQKQCSDLAWRQLITNTHENHKSKIVQVSREPYRNKYATTLRQIRVPPIQFSKNVCVLHLSRRIGFMFRPHHGLGNKLIHHRCSAKTCCRISNFTSPSCHHWFKRKLSNKELDHRSCKT